MRGLTTFSGESDVYPGFDTFFGGNESDAVSLAMSLYQIYDVPAKTF